MALILETLLSTGPLVTPLERAVRACLEVKKLISHRHTNCRMRRSWPVFRDYAIRPEMGYTIKVKLREAKYEKKEE